MRWKKSLLVIYQLVRLFFNALTAYDKHSLVNRDNLTEPIQMQLSQKQKRFSEIFFFFFSFLKDILNFKDIPKMDDPHSGCISEIQSSEKGC